MSRKFTLTKKGFLNFDAQDSILVGKFILNITGESMWVRKSILITNLEFQPKPTVNPVVEDTSFEGILNLAKQI